MALRYTKNAFAKKLVKRQKLVMHLDKALEEEPIGFTYTFEEKPEDDAWHPSSHCTPDVYELYDLATGNGTKRKFSVKNGQVGQFWHQLLQFYILKLEFARSNAIERRGHHYWGEAKRYSKEALYYAYPKAIDGLDWELAKILPSDASKFHLARPKPWHWVTGQADVAPCSIPRNGEWIVDFKTMGSHDYKQTGLPSWCADKYEAQINIYMDMFDLEQGLIVAIEKDSPHDMKEFVFWRNQPLIDTIYSKWEFVSELLDSGEEPNELDEDAFKLPLEGPVE